MIEKFDNKVYEERRECVELILNDQSKDNESITVDAKIEQKCPWLIKIEYTAVRNREIHTSQAVIPVDLAMKMSSGTLSSLLVDILVRFRSE